MLVPFSIFSAPGHLCPPLGVLRRPGPWSARLLKRCFCTAIIVRIRAFDCTLVGTHVCSRGRVLGSNPTTAKFLPNVFVARWQLLRNALSKGHHLQYITLFLKGTYSVIGFYELMGNFPVGLMHFLR